MNNPGETTVFMRFESERRNGRTIPIIHFPLRRISSISSSRPTVPISCGVGDITHVATDAGSLYLAAVLDVYSRKIVGWAMDRTMSRKLCMDARKMAVLVRQPAQGLLHHSDRGRQYASVEYQAMLEKSEMGCSMSRKGDCWDNAPMESFFGTLKTESLHLYKFNMRNEARREIFEYIEVFYNRKRSHSALGFTSPEVFDAQVAKAA